MEIKPIETPRLLLYQTKPENEKDMKSLLEYRNEEDYRNFCSNKRKLLSYDEFLSEYSQEFSKSRHLQLIIKHKKDKEFIGTIFSYGLNIYDGYIFVTIFLKNLYRGKGYAPEAIVYFIKFLFDNFSLYKIYMDVYEHNKLSLQTLKKRGAIVEGIFKKHRIYKNQRYDLYRFAVYQKDFKIIYDSVLSLLKAYTE